MLQGLLTRPCEAQTHTSRTSEGPRQTRVPIRKRNETALVLNQTDRHTHTCCQPDTGGNRRRRTQTYLLRQLRESLPKDPNASVTAVEISLIHRHCLHAPYTRTWGTSYACVQYNHNTSSAEASMVVRPHTSSSISSHEKRGRSERGTSVDIPLEMASI